MRIIAGKYKSRKLISNINNKNDLIRPTTDFLREALFNIIGEKIKNSYFLDIYAGTGAVGIEAISRGAKEVTFIEKNRMLINIIQKNLSLINENAIIIKKDAFDAIEKLNKNYDIIFIDPPYFENKENIILEKIFSKKNYNPNAIIILQHHKSISLTHKPSDIRKYGTNILSFYYVS